MKNILCFLFSIIFVSSCWANDRLQAGESLAPNSFLMSTNAAYMLFMQGDGKLSLLRADGSTAYTMAKGDAGTIAVMGADGNFVQVTPSGNVIWSTKTANACPCKYPPYIELLDNGNLLIWAGASPLVGSKLIWQLGADTNPLPTNPGVYSPTFPGTRPSIIPDPYMPSSL